MDPAQAAAAVAAAGTWQQPSASAQSSAYPQSYQEDQFQGYAGGTTLSPQQAAYFSQQVAQDQPYSAVNQHAYEQSQAFSAADFPASGPQGRFQPQNPVAGAAKRQRVAVRFEELRWNKAGSALRGEPPHQGEERPQRRHARGGSGG